MFQNSEGVIIITGAHEAAPLKLHGALEVANHPELTPRLSSSCAGMGAGMATASTLLLGQPMLFTHSATKIRIIPHLA